MIVDAPLMLPDDGGYQLLGRTEATRQLERLLRLVRPNARFAGFVERPEDARDGRLIVADMTVPGAAACLEPARTRDDLVLFPLPVGDMWSYWEFYRQIDSRLRCADGRVVVSAEDFIDLLCTSGRAVRTEQGTVGVSGLSYLKFHAEEVRAHSDEITVVRDGLSDEASRALYDELLYGEPYQHWARYLERAFRNIQYFEHVDFARCRSVINGGIFGGYELPFLIAHLPPEAVIHDVDPLGHDHLTAYVSPWVEAAAQAFRVHPMLLGPHDGIDSLSMLDDGQVSMLAGEEGKGGLKAYPCRSIDSLVAAQALDRVDLIKLDLEGGDRAAMLGATETIMRMRPQLALSIYHHVSDFWEIPLFVMRLCPDYDFYLNTYSYERWETILYAIPHEVEAARGAAG